MTTETDTLPAWPARNPRRAWAQVTTRAQREALARKFAQNADGAPTYRDFRRRAYWSFGVLMLPWCGMVLGIERDGYTHS